MLRYKHMRLHQKKIERAKTILKAKTETEAIEKALDMVLQKDQERIRKRKILKRMLEFRKSIGKLKEDSAEWVRLAREERMLPHGSST